MGAGCVSALCACCSGWGRYRPRFLPVEEAEKHQPPSLHDANSRSVCPSRASGECKAQCGARGAPNSACGHNALMHETPWKIHARCFHRDRSSGWAPGCAIRSHARCGVAGIRAPFSVCLELGETRRALPHRIDGQFDVRQVRAGRTAVAVVTDPVLACQLLRDHRTFDKDGLFITQVRPLLGLGLLTCPHHEHRRQRRLIQPAFHHTRLAGYAQSTCTWKPALDEAEDIPPRPEEAKPWQWQAAPKDGFHVLRHACAFPLSEVGEAVVTAALWLGCSSLAITLGYYAHFMPEAGSKGRTAIDGLPGRGVIGAPVDSPQMRPRADRGRFRGQCLLEPGC
ncbi:hypothetical protein SAMN05216268_120100 [Streptomyces yunnanensis]|uniref:Cytochrome P450 n=1 Tax=Streptomyces yunnanensis TaxID=156453 RepID=A0A9X8N629_9ACTN|nr:hypothetical protein SAMN05216268_120100 [Streptomyces yunnanensis]